MEKDERLEKELDAKLSKMAMYFCFVLLVTVSITFGVGLLQIVAIAVCIASVAHFVKANTSRSGKDKNHLSRP